MTPSNLSFTRQGGATLVFSIELLEIKQKGFITLPSGAGFYTAIGIFVIILLIVYELYKRVGTSEVKNKKQKRTINNKKIKKR